MKPFLLRPVRPLLVVACLGVLAACAQEPGKYETERGNTRTDAMERARGQTGTVAAPAQLQLGFGSQQDASTPPGAERAAADASSASEESGTAAASGASRALPAELSSTRSYLGTLPCPEGSGCKAMRISLTLAPDGQWRARETPLDGGGSAQARMGCWYLTGVSPSRIVLQSGEQSVAALQFQNTSVLGINWMGPQTPLLASHLTRQADIDPISELAGQPAVSCSGVAGH